MPTTLAPEVISKNNCLGSTLRYHIYIYMCVCSIMHCYCKYGPHFPTPHGSTPSAAPNYHTLPSPPAYAYHV